VKYHIAHTTRYHYSQPVQLSEHILRLRPRCDGTQSLLSYRLEIQPTPLKTSEILDLEGNACMSVCFPEDPLSEFSIHMEAEVETSRTNPFDYLAQPWAVTTPIDYPSSIAAALTPYLQFPRPGASSPAVVEWAQRLLHEVEGHVGFFLTQLTQTIYQDFEYLHRPVGDPQPVGVTMAEKAGSCRDFTVLFMAACQAVGLAARFVSGYQEGDLEQESRELHAWPEVYIPGGGWRGFDPTHGLAVSDRHLPLAAAAHPPDAAPVSGQLKPGYLAQSWLEYQIQIKRSEMPEP
jgi:transglutaminase-like putative cysteine protease